MTDATALRRRMVEAAYKAQEGHLPSSFSITEILCTLFDDILRPQDRFILSKGHASLALYTILEAKGKLPAGLLDTFCELGSPLQGHPTRHDELGITCTTGSLGHGICVAVGMAYALKLQHSDANVYCLVGDGECAEGSVYESLAIAAALHLRNLCVIVDQNNSEPMAKNLPLKFSAFGFDVQYISGHNPADLSDAFARHVNGKPRCIVAETEKGYGSAILEKEPAMYHHRALSKSEYVAIMETLA